MTSPTVPVPTGDPVCCFGSINSLNCRLPENTTQLRFATESLRSQGHQTVSLSVVVHPDAVLFVLPSSTELGRMEEMRTEEVRGLARVPSVSFEATGDIDWILQCVELGLRRRRYLLVDVTVNGRASQREAVQDYCKSHNAGALIQYSPQLDERGSSLTVANKSGQPEARLFREASGEHDAVQSAIGSKDTSPSMYIHYTISEDQVW